MTDLAIGVDICSVKRMEKAVKGTGDRFLKRVFTRYEQDYCLPKVSRYQCLAARFAAKEALLKALGTGLRGGLRWHDIEVISDKRGKPHFRFYDRCSDIIGKKQALLSISHTDEYAVAFVILNEH